MMGYILTNKHFLYVIYLNYQLKLEIQKLLTQPVTANSDGIAKTLIIIMVIFSYWV